MKATLYRDSELLETIKNETTRPILFTGGAVVTMNPQMGDWDNADVLIVGSLIVAVGPGLIKAAEDDKSIVINCDGMMVLPSKVDINLSEKTGSLTPGNTADLTVLRIKNAEPLASITSKSSLLDTVMKEGKILVWNGEHLTDTGNSRNEEANPSSENSNDSYVGTWIDETDFVKQELLPDGRYDEARGDRKSAFQGKYWIHGNRILYLDDLGFWAFGEFRDGILYHAGYLFKKH